jgi:hypothetical protein
VTAIAAARHAAPRILAGQYSQLRAAHPVSVLRWLRNGVLACVLGTTLLYLWVVTKARADIETAYRTSMAITDIRDAELATGSANSALGKAFKNEDVELTGAGSLYRDDISEVSKDLTLAAEANAAGQEGTSRIQFAQAQLQSYLTLSEAAVSDSHAGGPLVGAAEGYAASGNADLTSALKNLAGTETTALRAQLGAWPLDPGAFWWALLAPVVAMAGLAVATAHVLARHFRRHASRRLWGSLLMTTATAVTVGVFNWGDERHLSDLSASMRAGHHGTPPDPWAGHPAALTCALLLFLLAAVLAYLAYRPRLAEYRFEAS